MRYVIAVPAASPTDNPVTRRPTIKPGSAFHNTSTPAATIIVATEASITPRRPMRCDDERNGDQSGDRAAQPRSRRRS